MAKPRISIEACLNKGWEITKTHFGFILAVIIVTQAVNWAPALFSQTTSETRSSSVFLISFFFGVLSFVIELGKLNIALQYIDNQTPTLDTLFAPLGKVWNYFISSVIYSIILCGGLLVFIIPGIIFGVRLQFYGYFILEGAGPIEALEKSWDSTKGKGIDVFLLGLVLALMNIAGAIFLLVGLIITVPVTMIAHAQAYRMLKPKS